jgi:hypothetical protein
MMGKLGMIGESEPGKKTKPRDHERNKEEDPRKKDSSRPQESNV